MVLWKFDLLLEKDGTMEKTIVLWKKLWYFTENIGFTKGKYGRLLKTKKL